MDVVHNGDCLSPELTLLDVVYMYKWTESEPLSLQYTVIDPPTPYRKRPRSLSSKNAKTASACSSPKKMKIDEDSQTNNNNKGEETNKVSKSAKLTPTKIPSCKDSVTSSDVKVPSNVTTKNESLSNGFNIDGNQSSGESLNTSREDGDSDMVIDENPPNSQDMDAIENKQENNKIKEKVTVISSTPTTKENKVVSTAKASNSSIESLKALVNSSNYPPSKTTDNIVCSQTPLVFSAQQQQQNSPMVNSTFVNCISHEDSKPATFQNLTSPTITVTSGNSKPTSLNCVSTSHSVLTTVDTSILSSPIVMQQKPVITQPTRLPPQSAKGPVPIAKKPVSIKAQPTTPISTSSNTTQQCVKSTPATVAKPLLPKQSTNAVTKAVTSISKASTTPSSQVSSLAEVKTLPSPSSALLTPKPLPPTTSNAVTTNSRPLVTSHHQPSRLISNSYRAVYRPNSPSTPKPVPDPSKPRLGRPPNSARILASRMGMHPIQPRGISRAPFNHPKVVIPKLSIRGRPKAPGAIISKNSALPRLPATSVGQSNVITATKTASSVVPLTNGISKDIKSAISKNEIIASKITGTSSTPVAPKHDPPRISLSSTTVSSNKNGDVSNVSNNSGIGKGNIHVTSEKRTPKSTSATAGSAIKPPSKLTTAGSPSTPGMNNKLVKSPVKTKNVVANSASIHNIAQNLANKKLQQQNAQELSAAATASTTSSEFPAIPPMLPTALGLGLPVTAQLNMYMQNMILQQAAAARIHNLYPNLVQSVISEAEKKPKGDAVPMDLSPTNKGAPNCALSNSNGKVTAKSQSSPSVTTTTVSGNNKVTPTNKIKLKPKAVSKSSINNNSINNNNNSVPSKSSNIAPPTSEVTITKLSTASTNGNEGNAVTSSGSSIASGNSVSPLVSVTKSSNTVSITKRPSSSTLNSIGTPSGANKYGPSTRSPSNASVRQIPNPSLLSLSSEVRKNSGSASAIHNNNSAPSAKVNNSVSSTA